MAIYDDGRVACTEQEIIIRHYYFPLGAKHVPLHEIKEVRHVPLGTFGRWRIHGSGGFSHWFSFDPKRPRKRTALVIHTHSGFVRPVITPDDPERLVTELRARGVNTTTGTEAGLW